MALDYAKLVAHLQRPQRRVIVDWAEFACPHTLPVDLEAEWTAPADFAAANALMRKLPKLLRVVGAVTAAEMALPTWTVLAADADLPDSMRVAPASAIEAVSNWLAGYGRRDAMKAGAANAQSAARAIADPRARAAATAAESAADAAAWDSPKTTSAVRCYVLAVTPTISEAEAYRRWWRRATCRMALGPLHQVDRLLAPTVDGRKINGKTP